MKTDTKVRLVAAQLWIWLVFAVVYSIMDLLEPGKHFSPKDFNPAYFSAVTQTTLGGGEPRTTVAQFVIVCHISIASIAAVVLV